MGTTAQQRRVEVIERCRRAQSRLLVLEDMREAGFNRDECRAVQSKLMLGAWTTSDARRYIVRRLTQEVI